MGALQQALLMSSSGGASAVTWNPLDKAALIVLSGGDLIAGRTGATTIQSVRATTSRGAGSVGKWYFEVLVGAPSGTVAMSAGFAIATAPLNNFVGAPPVLNSWGYNANGSTYTNGTATSTGGAVPFSNTSVLNFALDATTGRVWMGHNGTWLNGGNPAAGTGQRYTPPAGAALYPMCCITEVTGQTFTGRFRAADFTYPLPAGFAAWE